MYVRTWPITQLEAVLFLTFQTTNNTHAAYFAAGTNFRMWSYLPNLWREVGGCGGGDLPLVGRPRVATIGHLHCCYLCLGLLLQKTIQ